LYGYGPQLFDIHQGFKNDVILRMSEHMEEKR
jgi:hypothetical protein